jgi:hypothetical protein
MPNDPLEDEHGNVSWLEESAFKADLPLVEVLAKFWKELKKLLPATELHVVDPYLLDAGGADAEYYAGNVVSLLNPALRQVDKVVFVYAKAREGIQPLIEADAHLVNSSASIVFRQGTKMHPRYLIADRSRVLLMEFSFNRIGKTFGTVSQVTDPEDLASILDELERLDPV